MIIKKIIVLFAIPLLASCGTFAPAPKGLSVVPVIQLVKIQKRFDGPAGTIQQDFTHAAASCKREVGSSGLMVGSNLVASCATFTNCMALKAFYGAPNGKYDPEELGLELFCYAD
jgi:hypothetical protein